VPHTPVWYMRQAGRSLPEYRRVREGTGMLESCMDPGLVTEITLQPVRRYGVDAAIFYSDIVLPLKAVGVDLDIKPGVGPVVAHPVRTLEDVAAIPDLTPDHVPFTTAAIRALVAELGATPLIGFAGAPFTVASYVVEGGPSRDYLHTKRLMYEEPESWSRLMGILVDATARYLNGQIAAGAEAVQIFDSWVGVLAPDDYRTFVLPHTRALIRALAPGTPVIHFGTGTASLLPSMRAAGGDVIGLDWRVDLDAGWAAVGHDVAVQGNLDPVVLLAKPAYIRARVKDILGRAGGRPGHIFNLGHGILPQTPVEHARALVEIVHELSDRR
jgi:uroporphyrinogen decarboxylase